VAPLAILALAAPATAAEPDVTRTSESAASAVTGSELEAGRWFAEADLTKSGPRLNLWYGTFDEDGGVETKVEATSGFSFRIARARLTSARLVAEDLPGLTCTYQGEEETGCVATPVDLSITWTGQGSIARGGSSFREKGDGYMIVGHGTGTTRDAAVTGTFTLGDVVVDASGNGALGTYKNFESMRCQPGACEFPEG